MTVTRYYGELAEVYRDKLTEHCFVAGMRVASFSEPASGDLAALSRAPLVQFARTSVFRPAVVLLVGEDAQRALTLVATIVLVGLIVLPPHRRRRVVGIALKLTRFRGRFTTQTGERS